MYAYSETEREVSRNDDLEVFCSVLLCLRGNPSGNYMHGGEQKTEAEEFVRNWARFELQRREGATFAVNPAAFEILKKELLIIRRR